MVEVEILGIVVTHQYGTLNTGDVLRTDSAFAKHLVEDCCAAKYRTAPSAPAEQAEQAEQVVEPAQAAAADAAPASKSRAKK